MPINIFITHNQSDQLVFYFKDETTVEGTIQGLNNDHFDHDVGEAGDGDKENTAPSQHTVFTVGQKQEVAELKFKR